MTPSHLPGTGTFVRRSPPVCRCEVALTALLPCSSGMVHVIEISPFDIGALILERILLYLIVLLCRARLQIR
ncbi:hypothetical protein K458DRAFT_176856 [Lentithecium fluviatile CBS 122367]|uniref:Uncharacterized protein n=1 Tax=Lentithecium fluviatile CBS 122367 TaxID=1168545 RepID=A0A6G1JDC2_9PLEO|nr:hypothetical protein K458DRAFT_176856 [Lentithecium fluviatile CBS 122367]